MPTGRVLLDRVLGQPFGPSLARRMVGKRFPVLVGRGNTGRGWDTALMRCILAGYSPVFEPYRGSRSMDGTARSAPEPRLHRQFEAEIHDWAHSLSFHNPITLYAVDQAVEFVPYAKTMLNSAETSVTDPHRSAQKKAASR